MHKSGIYSIKNKINGKIYIGCSKKIEVRWRKHCHKLKNRKSVINDAIQKHGSENFEFEILLECPSICFDYWEQYYISKFSSIVPIGYNLTSGGEYKKTYSKETRDKISKSTKGRIISDVCRKRASECNKGNKHALGYVHTDYWKKEQSARTKGIPKTKEHNEKNRLSNLGKKRSDATKIKIGLASKARVITDEARINMSNAQKGRKHSEETKEKIRQSNLLRFSIKEGN